MEVEEDGSLGNLDDIKVGKQREGEVKVEEKEGAERVQGQGRQRGRNTDGWMR